MGWQGYQTVEAANKMVSRTFVLLEGDLSMVTLIQYIYIYIDVKDYHTLHQQRGSWPWQSALQDSSDCDGHFGHAWCVAPRAAKQLPYHEA